MIRPKKMAFINSLVPPSQKALKLGLSAMEITWPFAGGVLQQSKGFCVIDPVNPELGYLSLWGFNCIFALLFFKV
jgi:hypothetical protein